MLLDIRPDHLRIVQDLLQQHVPTHEVWAFGSRAKWTAKDYSDLDLCIVSETPLSFRTLGLLEEAFDESNLPYKVDIVDWATTSESFRKIIERDKVQIQESQAVENWTTKLVSDIAELNPSRSLKKGATSPFIEMAALPVNGRDIPVQDVSSRDFSGSGSRFVNGDVLLARITPCLENGKTALVNVLAPSVVGHGSTEFIVLSPKESSDQRFIYYLARHPDFREYAIQHMEGTSGRQRVSARAIGAYRFPCPPSSQRKEIGDTLGALDDRISLLRETNATLEAIAQALFKSWFVDFDPVRARAEGREPEGVPPEIAALFPSEFEDSELGEIPKGWRITTLAEHVAAERGLSYKGAGLCGQEDGRPMHNLNSVYEGGGYKYPGIKFYSGDFKERHLAVAGDIIVANTEQGHEHRLIGFPAIVPAFYPEGLFSHHLYRVRRKAESPLTQHVLYYLLMAPYVREQIIGCANGSTVNMLKSAGLEIPRFVCPPAGLSAAFEDLAKPLHLRIEHNVQQAEELAGLRDTLLPRLMSGKLRIPEAVA